jgi:hypothetical protein
MKLINQFQPHNRLELPLNFDERTIAEAHTD